MDGAERRQKILQFLRESKEPLSGTELARQMGVSRQVIVQDIALLRAQDRSILSTSKGYMIFSVYREEPRYTRCFKVQHDTEDIMDEFYTIVDRGGRILDVIVEHDVYGVISVDMIIGSRVDADDFVRKMKSAQGNPLKVLTGGVHFHTVEAGTEQILDHIQGALAAKGYLIEE